MLTTPLKNSVLQAMEEILQAHAQKVLDANRKDVELFDASPRHVDEALRQRLELNNKDINAMCSSLRKVREKDDPVGRLLYHAEREDGLRIENRSAPFGRILIIYESRPDVSVEAASLAFKAGSAIVLKGGKEARYSNRILVECWHQALESCGCSTDWVRALELKREETQAYLINAHKEIDLVVPRGGETLIDFVKKHASCAVLVSGRGNNFAYCHHDADVEMATRLILNGKTHKISACNAIDKVIVNEDNIDLQKLIRRLFENLIETNIEIVLGPNLRMKSDSLEILKHKMFSTLLNHQEDWQDDIWSEEFLSRKIVIDVLPTMDAAITLINQHSGGHSAMIVTENPSSANHFMQNVDAAALYHNASTRFTDGGQLGLGAELAISTDKLHHRGPLGLQELVTNKYFIYGSGHIRT